VDDVHSLGMVVLGELVHAHAAASDNCREGLPQTPDGGPYFKAGAAGQHAQWGSRLFDYSRAEVLRLLLANIKHWATNYRLDGFRLDAASTILYGQLGGAPADYGSFFGAGAVDEAGLLYLQLASHLAKHGIAPPLTTVVEEARVWFRALAPCRRRHSISGPHPPHPRALRPSASPHPRVPPHHFRRGPWSLRHRTVAAPPHRSTPKGGEGQPVVPSLAQVSGYPGMCAPLEQLGLGFDYRMDMGLPDLWSAVLSLEHAPPAAPLPIRHLVHVLTRVRAVRLLD